MEVLIAALMDATTRQAYQPLVSVGGRLTERRCRRLQAASYFTRH
jgi:hypothetical protein